MKFIEISNDTQVGSLIVYALQVWDFSSDCNFAWCLYIIWIQLDKENDFIYALMWVSIICLVIPWMLNLAYIIIQRWRWSRHSIVNAWIRDYAWLLICLCMFSGGANSSILLCNSRLFGLLPFQMELPRYEYIKSSKWPLFFVTMFENIPQIVVQFSFVAHYSLETDSCNIYTETPDDQQLCTAALQSTAFSSVSSIVAVIFAFGVCLLQCSDPLDDKRFILDVKLDEDEDEAKVRLQLGMRRRISLSVAQAIEMHDSVICIDAVKFGYNRLKFVMSVTESVKHFNGDKDAVRKRRLAKRRSTFIDKLGSALRNDEDEDLDEIHYDKLLHQLLTAKSNGKLAASMKRGLKLQYMPIVDNIEIPEMNTMPNMDQVVQNLKMNLRDQDEVVIVASGGAKRALSYDDDQRIHQQTNVNAVPVAMGNNNNNKKFRGQRKKKKQHQSLIELQQSKPGYAKVASLQSLATQSNQSEIGQQTNIIHDNNEILEEKMSPSRNESGNRLLDDAGSGRNSSNSRDDEVIDDIINDTDKGGMFGDDALHVIPKVKSLNIEGLNKNNTEEYGGNTGGGNNGGDVGVTPGYNDDDDATSSTDNVGIDVDNIADQDVIDAFKEKDDEDEVDNMDNSIGADDEQDLDLVQEVNGVTMM